LSPRLKLGLFIIKNCGFDGSIRNTLNGRTTAYNFGLISGHMDEYKAASYRLRRAVKDAKRWYRDRVETQMKQPNTRSLWQRLQTITDYRGRIPSTVSANESLVDDLNSFDARFEVSNNTVSGTVAEVSSIARDEHTLSVTKHDMRRALMTMNTRKAVGPDGISGGVLKNCANQLASVFTKIFNLSLAESVVPACFMWFTIVPVPKSASPACLNDYQPVAITSVVMTFFERMIKDYI